ncbi:YceG-like family protein [Bacillus oleivorans]|uniref:YceG-like family protein n=1 Tax=Bacillus oleivorans TaxID=1448271 RepID=A0A285CLJ2_9BACI|nr:endolytic transglycosylase MltG [Bacillus oleivorans]SNX67918.1 YceG-like family protein [Bacillus oleivorans]
MQRQLIQGFAIGMFLTACISLLGFYNLNINEQNIDPKQAIEELEQSGYQVLSTAEWNDLQTQIVNNKPQEEEAAEEEEQDETENSSGQTTQSDEKKSDTKSYTLTIEAGMNSSDVSERLEENGIVEDSFVFQQYLIDRNLDGAIQIGSYQVSSDMSFEVITSIITKGR